LIGSYEMSEREITSRAKRSLWMLKRHRSDFAKVTAERIRLIERFIADPRRNSPGMMRIITQPFDGL
jgi:hypothetical protein